MAEISTWIETIRTAIYGKDMRNALYQSIKALDSRTDDEHYEIFTNFTKNLHKDYELVEKTFTPSYETDSYVFNSELYNDSLTVWKNSHFLSDETDYTMNYASGMYEIKFKNPLVVGDKVILQFWNIPEGTGKSTVGTLSVIASGTTASVIGIATQIEG